MKKLVLLFAVAAMTVSASAQSTVYEASLLTTGQLVFRVVLQPRQLRIVG